MISLFSVFIFCVAFLYVSYINRNSFYKLITCHLALLAQTPVIMFLQHNLDKSRLEEPAWPLMLPVLISVVILSMATAQIVIKKSYKLSFLLSPILIGYAAYSVFCVVSAFYGSDPRWSLYAILWTLPFGFIYFLAGRNTDNLDSEGATPLSYSVIFSCLLSIAIVVFALVTGRANTLFNTRSFGSILSITGILQMLILYVPMASFEKRKSKILNLLFWGLPLAAFALSLSRSAIAPFLVYLIALAHSLKFDFKTFFFRPIVYLASGVVSLIMILVLSFTEIGAAWLNRFINLPYAMQLRLELFAPYWHTAKVNNPFYGVGYGLTKFHNANGFTDLHNMLLTELFENGLGAAVILAALLVVVLFYIFYCLKNRTQVLIALTALFTLILAHLQGINLAIRNPEAYNTPYVMCVLFFMFGILEKQVLGKNDQA